MSILNEGAVSEIQINSIVIGERVRKDMGDLTELAKSMKSHGLLHPIVVKKDKTLVAGQRRIEAARLLGWRTIPVTMVDVTDLLSAERDENVERKDFTPTEAVEIGRMIEEQHRIKIQTVRHDRAVAAGKARQGDRSMLNQHHALGAVDRVAGAAVGMGYNKYIQAKAVVVAAESDPEKFGDLPNRMDETGNVSGTHRELRRRKTGKGRNPALRKMQHLKPNREVERAIHALDGICHCFRELPFDKLDPTRTRMWAKALKNSASIIRRTARRIENAKAH